MSKDDVLDFDGIIHCSFCGKGENEVSRMLAGPPGIYICNECVMICESILAEDEVGINNKVTLYFEEDDLEETYKIVTGIRSDSLNGYISIESPLGKAVLGHKVGDRVCIKVNDSYSYYVVVKALDASTDDSEDKIASY